jgi:hypothetical protein
VGGVCVSYFEVRTAFSKSENEKRGLIGVRQRQNGL